VHRGKHLGVLECAATRGVRGRAAVRDGYATPALRRYCSGWRRGAPANQPAVEGWRGAIDVTDLRPEDRRSPRPCRLGDGARGIETVALQLSK
jgi:hypothetical protein